MRLTNREWEGVKRPFNGPYPKGVVNGPQPTTERGIRSRKQNMSSPSALLALSMEKVEKKIYVV